MLDNRVKWFDMRRWLPGPWPVDIELQDDEWERDPNEPESAVGTVYESAPRPSWTTEPPTLPGLYFVRMAGGPTRVVEVFWDRGWMAQWSDIEPFRVVGSGFQFSRHSIREPVDAG